MQKHLNNLKMSQKNRSTVRIIWKDFVLQLYYLVEAQIGKKLGFLKSQTMLCTFELGDLPWNLLQRMLLLDLLPWGTSNASSRITLQFSQSNWWELVFRRHQESRGGRWTLLAAKGNFLEGSKSSLGLLMWWMANWGLFIPKRFQSYPLGTGAHDPRLIHHCPRMTRGNHPS